MTPHKMKYSLILLRLKGGGITENEVVKSIKRHKKIVSGVIVSLCTLCAIYFGMAIYFMNHFYFGSEINGIKVSGKSVESVNKQMASKLENYVLNLNERDGKNEQIKADEVGLKYISDGDFKSLKDRQKPFNWISAFLNTEASKMTEEVKYDEKLLKELVDKLLCFDGSNIIEPKNPDFKYTDKGYVIIDEVKGNKVDKDVLYKYVSDAILMREAAVDLETINCYINPQYTSRSQKIIEIKDMLNKYVSSKITYTFGENKEILDGAVINKWLTVNENMEVNFDEAKAKEYIDMLSNSYSTIGKVRSFVTSSGKTITISGGDYGWSINTAKEAQALIAAIKEGKTITKEPVYKQTALSHGRNDIGNTFVEIDLTKQHLWFYKNGSLIVQGDVVTGNVSAGHTTPPGIYRLKYKERNAVLRGVDYAAPVDFWMPFNGGIGIHDANWRSVFGGTIYKTAGSHGCVNSPYYLAKTIFDNIEAGTPVVCYN